MRPLAFTLAALVATPALAHTGAGVPHGFAAGLVHPLFGLDHLLAIVAVGLLAGFQGGKALWLWPASFVVAMVGGGALGMSGAELPAVEAMILVSIVVLGALLTWGASVPLAAGAATAGLFALFHGHAHGTELAAEASGFAYAAGFALATCCLQAVGILLARLGKPSAEPAIRRASGVAIAGAGLFLAVLS